MTNHVIAYSRVSTSDGGQSTISQEDKLDEYARREGIVINKIFLEHYTGTKASRPEWDKVRAQLRSGDTLLVTRLDRLSRSTKDLLEISQWLDANNVSLIVTEQKIDTSSPEGRLFFRLMASFAEFERDLIVSRTQDGLAAARARGRNGGRKEKLTPAQKKEVIRLYNAKDLSVQQIADLHKVSRGTVYTVIKESKVAA